MSFETLMLSVNVLNTGTGMSRAEASLCPPSMKPTGRGGRLKGGTKNMMEVQWMKPKQQSRVFLACRSQIKTQSL